MSQEDIPPKDKIYAPATFGALRQGEIISDLVQFILRPETINTEDLTGDPLIHPLAIIVSQDCDLDQDFRARNGLASEDKKLPNVLFCQMISAENLRGRSDINAGLWPRIRNNKDERYHFFQKINSEDDALQEGLPELGVDFKRYFSTRETKFRCVLFTAKRCCEHEKRTRYADR